MSYSPFALATTPGPLTRTEADTLYAPAASVGRSATTFAYQAEAVATSGNPGTRSMLWNAATQINATALHVNHLTNDNIDIDVLLGFTHVDDALLVQDANLSDNYQTWTVTGTPQRIVSGTPYWVIPVTLIGSGGTGTTDFPNNHELILCVIH